MAILIYNVDSSAICVIATIVLRFNVIFTISHSNTGEERIFSCTKKNKTPCRSSLSLSGTFCSILTVKTQIIVKT